MNRQEPLRRLQAELERIHLLDLTHTGQRDEARRRLTTLLIELDSGDMGAALSSCACGGIVDKVRQSTSGLGAEMSLLKHLLIPATLPAGEKDRLFSLQVRAEQHLKNIDRVFDALPTEEGT